jgi:hypothetical protein
MLERGDKQTLAELRRDVIAAGIMLAVVAVGALLVHWLML